MTPSWLDGTGWGWQLLDKILFFDLIHDWPKSKRKVRAATNSATKALREENDALRAQLKGVGIVPYLDRMRELGERIEARESANRALVEAARKHLAALGHEHGEPCDVGEGCTLCGLSAALAAHEERSKASTSESDLSAGLTRVDPADGFGG